MKFGNLLKKELGGLLTVQALISMAVTCVLLIAMGQFMGTAMEEGMDVSEVNICNLDDSEFTSKMLEELEEYGTTPKLCTLESSDYAAELERLGLDNVVVIPEGFGKSVTENKAPADIIFAAELKMGISGTMKSITASDAVSAIESYTSDHILTDTFGLSDEELEWSRSPAVTVEYTTMNGKTAKVSPNSLAAVIMMQTMIVPIAVFFLLLMASQMIMTAISTEKIDKTLETLLSAPVPRLTVLTAKMTAAFIVALLNALVMMIGFAGYIMGMMGSASDEMMFAMNTGASQVTVGMEDTLNAAQGMAQLGMNIGVGGYLLMGLQMFVSIAIGLSLALILGALCEDVQSMNTLLMPIMILVMIPFFATMFIDINSAGIGAKIILYAIPFTHSYASLSNLMAGNTALFWGGFAYQVLFLAVCMFFAVKMFTTDKIFTMTGAVTAKIKKK